MTRSCAWPSTATPCSSPDESEIIVKKHGLDTFFQHEKEFENLPLAQVVLLTGHVFRDVRVGQPVA